MYYVVVSLFASRVFINFNENFIRFSRCKFQLSKASIISFYPKSNRLPLWNFLNLELFASIERQDSFRKMLWQSYMFSNVLPI